MTPRDRCYDVQFTVPGARAITIRAGGNTRRSAERRARRWLRDDHGIDPRQCSTIAITYVPRTDRDR